MNDIKYGTLGFVYTKKAFFSESIVEITDDDFKDKDFIASHVFIVLENGYILEASAIYGVRISHLVTYTDESKYDVKFKNPRQDLLDPTFAKKTTKEFLNKKYNYKLLIGLLITNTIGKFFSRKLNNYILARFDSDNRFICSELAVEWSLKVGTFQKKETDRISPVRLYYTSKNLVHDETKTADY